MDFFQNIILSLSESNEIDNRLRKFLQVVNQPVSISIYANDQVREWHSENFSSSLPVTVGCIARSITASLVGVAIYEKKLSLEDKVSDYFRDCVFQINFEHFDKLKIFHLLNHTHGFDAYSVNCENYIEFSANYKLLINHIYKNDCLGEPGEIVNYSKHGSWLAAVILERIYGKPYVELVTKLLFESYLNLRLNLENPTNICPAIGMGLCLSSKNLQAFALLHLKDSSGSVGLMNVLKMLREKYLVQSHEGKMYSIKISPAWMIKNSSFGHGGNTDSGSACIHCSPMSGSFITITSTHKVVAKLAFNKIFYELDESEFNLPKAISNDSWNSIDKSSYLGIYGNSNFLIKVDISKNKLLRVNVYKIARNTSLNERDLYLKRNFRTLEDISFLAFPPEPLVIPMLYFENLENGKYNHISTGKYVFRRIK